MQAPLASANIQYAAVEEVLAWVSGPISKKATRMRPRHPAKKYSNQPKKCQG